MHDDKINFFHLLITTPPNLDNIVEVLDKLRRADAKVLERRKMPWLNGEELVDILLIVPKSNYSVRLIDDLIEREHTALSRLNNNDSRLLSESLLLEPRFSFLESIRLVNLRHLVMNPFGEPLVIQTIRYK